MFSAEPLGGGIEQHAPTAADFWYDTNLEHDLDSLLGDVEQTLASASADRPHDRVQRLRLRGHGQTVAVIDSGIAWDHPNLGGGFGAEYRVVGGWDFTEENDANPYDDGPAGSHGTHVAGIVGATANRAGDVGVAPGVDLVGLRVFNDQGEGYFSWVEKALEWVHTNRNAFANPITAVNLSLGTAWNAATVPSWAMLEDEFAQLKADGIFIAVSAGNSFTSYNTPGLSYPAASSNVVPVMSGRRLGFAELLQPTARPGDRRAGPVDSQHGARLRRQSERRDRRLGELQRHQHGFAVCRRGERDRPRGDGVRRLHEHHGRHDLQPHDVDGRPVLRRGHEPVLQAAQRVRGARRADSGTTTTVRRPTRRSIWARSARPAAKSAAWSASGATSIFSASPPRPTAR